MCFYACNGNRMRIQVCQVSSHYSCVFHCCQDVVEKADEDKEYFISELDKQSMLLDELAAQKKGQNYGNTMLVFIFLGGGRCIVYFNKEANFEQLLHVSKGGSRKLIRYFGKELTRKSSCDKVYFRCSMNKQIFLTQLDKPYFYLLWFLGLESKNKQNTDNIKALQVSELKKCTIHNFCSLP